MYICTVGSAQCSGCMIHGSSAMAAIEVVVPYFGAGVLNFIIINFLLERVDGRGW